MYFDEDLVLEIRLNTLNNIVDKFVIAEATRDHAGREKKLNFEPPTRKSQSKFKQEQQEKKVSESMVLFNKLLIKRARKLLRIPRRTKKPNQSPRLSQRMDP